jgi:hypothetical protein
MDLLIPKPDGRCRIDGQQMKLFFIAMLLFLMALMPYTASTVEAADTAMKHTPPDYFVSEHRMQLDVDVRDPGGINLVRCYFKAVGEADLVFVPMNPAGANKYAGILPAPSATTDQIEYLFLAVNGSNQVVRTQSFYIYKDNTQETPAWQDIPKEGEIRVSMELDAAPKELRGFSDNVTIDVVESGVRFGVVALLYDASQTGGGAGTGATGSATAATSAEAAGLTGAAATATSGGTITASTIGFSTTTLVAAGAVGAAAVGGGVAAASSSSSGGGSSKYDPSAPTLEISSREVVACVVDWNNIQDDYYDMYLNGKFIGKIENPPGGTVCYNISLRSGNNILELRLKKEMESGTDLNIDLNNGEEIANFFGTTNHKWNIVVSEPE